MRRVPFRNSPGPLVLAVALTNVSACGSLEVVAGSLDGGIFDSNQPDRGAPDSNLAEPDTGTGGDASYWDASYWDAGAPPGTIPMFVALGHRGRTLVSCDGIDWVGEHIFGGKAGDHGPYAALGRMAYGDGKFIACVGWGDPMQFLYSENGVDWEQLPESALVPGRHRRRALAGCSGIGWDGVRFAAAAFEYLYTSSDGRTWIRNDEPLPGTGTLRNFRGGNGLLAFVRSGVAYFSSDGGASWYTGSSFDPECGKGLQRAGRILFDAGRVLIVGQRVCVSEDGGRTFYPSTEPLSGKKAAVWDGDRYLVGGLGAVALSPNGREWSQPVPVQNMNFSAMAYASSLGYVGVHRNGTDFVHSADGIHWTPARYEGPESDPIMTIVAGFGTPSALCPTP